MSRSLRVKGGLLALPYCGEECERNLIPTRHLLSVEMIYPSPGEDGEAVAALHRAYQGWWGRAPPPRPRQHFTPSSLLPPDFLVEAVSSLLMFSLVIDQRAERKRQGAYEWM